MRRSDDRAVVLADGWVFRAEGLAGWSEDGWRPIAVPGSWESLGVPHDWEGPGWYRRRTPLPADWRGGSGERLWLKFGAVCYDCRVWVNGVETGTHRGAWDAFTFDVTEAAGGAESLEIVVRVVKPGGPTFPTQTTASGFLPYVWGYLAGGLWQAVTLERTGPARVPDTAHLIAHIEPDGTGVVGLYGLNGTLELLGPGGETLAASEPADLHEQRWAVGEHTQAARAALPDALAWSPDAPTLYTARVRALTETGEVSDEVLIPFGFREVRVAGDTPLLNGKPFYPRMPLSWGWYPETLHANPPAATLRAELEGIRALGYNGVKCCLCVPPPATLDLCDELGLLVWLELPLWLPEMNESQRAQVAAEYARIVRQVRHHPCIVIWTLGCELSAACPADFLRDLTNDVKLLTGSPLVRDNSGGGECYEGHLQEHADFQDTHFYCDLPFLRPTFDTFLPRWRPPQPWFHGEFCDADAFRNLEAIRERHDGELPWWTSPDPAVNPQGARWDSSAQVLWANWEKHSLSARREELKEGQRQQTLLHRKYTLELVRSYREMSGYVVTGLADTPISIAGMFDEAGEPRYAPEEFTPFNADTVLLLGWHRRRQWVAGGDRPSSIDTWCHWSGETVQPRLGVSHYGQDATISRARLELRDAQYQGVEAFGKYATYYFPGIEGLRLTPGNVIQLGSATLQLPQVDRMTRFLLSGTLVLEEGGRFGGRAINKWPLWVVPKPDWGALPRWSSYDPAGALHGLSEHGAVAEEDAALLVASRWHGGIADRARNGGRAFVFVEQGGGLPVVACPFWREAMKLFEPHPLWEHFPHEGFTDLHFYGLGPDCAFERDALRALFPEAEYRPILRRVDARTFDVTDYMAELTFPGGGRLLLTTLRLQGGLGDQPDGLLRNVAGVHLLASILRILGQTA